MENVQPVFNRRTLLSLRLRDLVRRKRLSGWRASGGVDADFPAKIDPRLGVAVGELDRISAVEPILKPGLLEGAPHRIVAKIGNPGLSGTARWGDVLPADTGPAGEFAAELQGGGRRAAGRAQRGGGTDDGGSDG